MSLALGKLVYILFVQEGSTALILAAKNAYMDLVGYFLDQGSDLRRMNKVHTTFFIFKYKISVHS